MTAMRCRCLAHKAQAVMATDTNEAIADKGYYKGEEIVACEQDGIAVVVSKPHTSNAAAVGRFDKADFIYHTEKDAYLCPAGEWLPYHYSNEETGKTLRNYWTNACGQCPVKAKSTTGKERRVKRWEHEAILERVQKRLDDDPTKIPLRSKTVEHPFGTIKAWMGATHFKMKTMKHVATEIALHVLAYNMMRALAIMGVTRLIEAMRG
jgi:Transposase DDE domain